MNINMEQWLLNADCIFISSIDSACFQPALPKPIPQSAGHFLPERWKRGHNCFSSWPLPTIKIQAKTEQNKTSAKNICPVLKINCCWSYLWIVSIGSYSHSPTHTRIFFSTSTTIWKQMAKLLQIKDQQSKEKTMPLIKTSRKKGWVLYSGTSLTWRRTSITWCGSDLLVRAFSQVSPRLVCIHDCLYSWWMALSGEVLSNDH